ncbi:hypothetical protein HAL07_10030 [Helicobacter ailurogastricus]|uniref:Uncharacterized protein n=1 Tax=Helicobacter ailurogastricus TaxID=1578720 RepID=A0A0K2Y0T8_9HELI|nr:hypothetical protein HAL07_10030 [Helicobacter ailurogastricus]
MDKPYSSFLKTQRTFYHHLIKFSKNHGNFHQNLLSWWQIASLKCLPMVHLQRAYTI